MNTRNIEPYLVKHNDHDYYRLFILPHLPLPNQSVRNGQLVFNHTHTQYAYYGDWTGRLQTIDYFNVIAMSANRFPELINNGTKREICSAFTNDHALTIDVERNYYDRGIKINIPFEGSVYAKEELPPVPFFEAKWLGSRFGYKANISFPEPVNLPVHERKITFQAEEEIKK